VSIVKYLLEISNSPNLSFLFDKAFKIGSYPILELLLQYSASSDIGHCIINACIGGHKDLLLLMSDYIESNSQYYSFYHNFLFN